MILDDILARTRADLEVRKKARPAMDAVEAAAARGGQTAESGGGAAAAGRDRLHRRVQAPLAVGGLDPREGRPARRRARLRGRRARARCRC